MFINKFIIFFNINKIIFGKLIGGNSFFFWKC